MYSRNQGGAMTENILHGREVIIEFSPVGQYVKVSALDTKTLTEICIQFADLIFRCGNFEIIKITGSNLSCPEREVSDRADDVFDN